MKRMKHILYFKDFIQIDDVILKDIKANVISLEDLLKKQ